jgi:geranylgeranyl reductase family protein
MQPTDAIKSIPSAPLETVDVAIVGAGPAGTAAAYDLRQAGKSVLLLDHHAFPRPKACAGGLTVKTLAALRFSVEPVIRCRCRALDIGKGLSRRVRFDGRRTICAMTVRAELDHFCLEKARAAGARFKRIGRLQSIREHANGVAIQTGAGLIRAAFLVGADGAQSRVRRLTGEFPGHCRGFALEGTLPANPARPCRMGFDFNVIPFGYGWVFPKGDHINIGLFSGHPATQLKKRDLFTYARRKLGRGDIHNPRGHPLGLGGWHYRPRSRRILLAGDAAGLADPLLGEGLYNAIRSGQLSARAILTSESENQTAGFLYDHYLKPIRIDLQLCRASAAWFYRMPNWGHWALTSRPVKYALMKGFALGWPLGRIGMGFYRLPFLTSR